MCQAGYSKRLAEESNLVFICALDQSTYQTQLITSPLMDNISFVVYEHKVKGNCSNQEKFCCSLEHFARISNQFIQGIRVVR